MIPIFDAHLDLAWNALSFNRDLTLPVAQTRRREGHMNDHPSRGGSTVSLPELRRAGVGVCVATLLARAGPRQEPQPGYRRTDLDHAAPSIAYAVAQGQLAYYRLLESQGHLRFIRSAGQLDRHWRQWTEARDSAPLGIVLGMEGTDPVVAPDQLEAWWDDGLRVAGLAHYGESRHAGGTGCDTPLTDDGLRLLEHFERLGMVLDVTHLCDRSLAQALDVFGGRLMASHHNCRALVPGDRQLTDAQIRRLVGRGAVIGTALDAWMLHPGWVHGQSTPDVVGIRAAADHVDHVCQLAGNARHAGIGSDLDGGFGREQTPHDLDTAADLQTLAEILKQRGYGDEQVAAVFHGNWLRFFREALPGSEEQ